MVAPAVVVVSRIGIEVVRICAERGTTGTSLRDDAEEELMRDVWRREIWTRANSCVKLSETSSSVTKDDGRLDGWMGFRREGGIAVKVEGRKADMFGQRPANWRPLAFPLGVNDCL